MGKDYSIIYNSDSSYVLLKNASSNAPSGNLLHYIVYETKTEKKITEEKLINADVKWIKRHILLITLFPGVESALSKDNEMRSYYFDVLRQSKKFL